MQLVKEVSALYSSTVPGYTAHTGDMLLEAEFTKLNFPGEQQDTQVSHDASPGFILTSHAV